MVVAHPCRIQVAVPLSAQSVQWSSCQAVPWVLTRANFVMLCYRNGLSIGFCSCDITTTLPGCNRWRNFANPAYSVAAWWPRQTAVSAWWHRVNHGQQRQWGINWAIKSLSVGSEAQIIKELQRTRILYRKGTYAATHAGFGPGGLKSISIATWKLNISIIQFIEGHLPARFAFLLHI